MKNIDLTLYFITNSEGMDENTFLTKVNGACLGGATLVQLREKNKSTREYYQLACKVKKLTDAFSIPLIIDDRIDVAMAVGCGVHLGTEDMPISIARSLMGEDAIIGATAKSVEAARQAEKEGADYLGCGAIYPTKTHVKTKLTKVETLDQICEAVHIPVAAIGGLKKDNLEVLANSPIQGICVVSAIMDADDTKQASQELLEAIHKTLRVSK